MCYSALVKQSLKELALQYRARIDTAVIEDYFHDNEAFKPQKAFEFNFRSPVTEAEKRIHELILARTKKKVVEIEQDLFAQRERLANAERKLATKPTKAAEKDKGVAQRQIDRLKNRLARIHLPNLIEEDSRIYAFDWAPVIIWRDNERVIVPMRYHLRPPGMKADFDKKYPGCYNARRDSLTGFWREQFGKNHAVLIASAFYENVRNQKNENQVLKFAPRGFDHMVIPCIYAHWENIDGPGFESFALITDNPPPEVSEAGHDRCPIFIKESRIDDWLKPLGKSDADLFKILDDRERPYYEHALTG